MSEDTPRIIESQVDWITAIGAGQPWADRLASFGQHLLALEVDKGNKLHEFECYSYRGHHSGQASLGWQDDRTLVQLSGQLAADKWGEAMKHSTTVTRLDLQVTAVIVPDDPDLAERLYALARRQLIPARARYHVVVAHVHERRSNPVRGPGGKRSDGANLQQSGGVRRAVLCGCVAMGNTATA